MKKLIILFIFFGLFGCKSTQYVPQIIVKDSVIYFNKVKLDSVYIYKQDSIIIRQKGDSIFTDRWHTFIKNRDVLKTDSISKWIYVKETKTVTTNKLTKVQKTLMWTGGILSVLFFILGVLKIRSAIK